MTDRFCSRKVKQRGFLNNCLTKQLSGVGLRDDYSNSRPTSLSLTRRPASADRTARRQYQATGQPLSRTQASDAMTSRLPRYEAKCVQRRCFQCGSVPLRSDIKGTELLPANILIPLERRYNFALRVFLYNDILQQTFLFVLYCRNCPKDDKCKYFIPILRKLWAT